MECLPLTQAYAQAKTALNAGPVHQNIFAFSSSFSSRPVRSFPCRYTLSFTRPQGFPLIVYQ